MRQQRAAAAGHRLRDSGEQCTPGNTLADGFYTLQNSSHSPVTVTGVRLIGGAGQKVTSPAYLIPVVQTSSGGTVILGLNHWPVKWPTWKDRKRVPATKVPHGSTNLVFAQTAPATTPKTGGGAGHLYRWQQQLQVNRVPGPRPSRGSLLRQEGR